MARRLSGGVCVALGLVVGSWSSSGAADASSCKSMVDTLFKAAGAYKQAKQTFESVESTYTTQCATPMQNNKPPASNCAQQVQQLTGAMDEAAAKGKAYMVALAAAHKACVGN